MFAERLDGIGAGERGTCHIHSDDVFVQYRPPSECRVLPSEATEGVIYDLVEALEQDNESVKPIAFFRFEL